MGKWLLIKEAVAYVKETYGVDVTEERMRTAVYDRRYNIQSQHIGYRVLVQADDLVNLPAVQRKLRKENT